MFYWPAYVVSQLSVPGPDLVVPVPVPVPKAAA